LLGFVLICSIFAPLISGDPNFIDVFSRMKPPSADYWFGTDMLGRDIYNRTVYGGRVSLWVGLSVASLSTLIGLVIGLASGYWRQIDTVVMRTMDGIMAIPGILFAMALVALTEASIGNVIFAITVVETPRVVRLVRSVVLTLREQPYVDAAVTVGSGAFKIMFRHILPNTMAPLIVQATFICAQAILIEAALSFLGVGTPSEVPTWGNIISEGRLVFQIAPWNILFPGIALSLTVLSMNLLGDGLRDTLDPRLARRM
jgi:peptide/nickel transport system permease protein